MATGQPLNAMNRPAGKQVPCALLLPVLEQQLDKDRAMQLKGLYVLFRRNNINKEEFIRHMQSLVGDNMLKMAAYKVQQEQLTAKSSMDNNAKKQRLLEHQSDSHGVKASHKSPNVNAIKQERDQQHIPFTNMNMSSQSFEQQTHDLLIRQGPVPTMVSDMTRLHGGGLAHFTSSSGQSSMHKDQSRMSSVAYVKQEPLDQIIDQQHISQLSAPQGPSSISPGQIESSKDETLEMMSSRPGFSTSMNEPEPMSITAQLDRQYVSAGNSSLASGSNANTAPKKPTVGQNKTSEAPVSLLSKRQKVCGAFSDQSIEQLNDITAVSGVHLREEEERLFSGSKEDSRVSEATRKIVQEKEERLILQKTPLQKKLAETMTKGGVKIRSNDMERCLSLHSKMEVQGSPLDRISSLPPNIIQRILTLMPMRDAFRTSILSQNWRNHCLNIPKLMFDDALFQESTCKSVSIRWKLLYNVYPILLLHQGPIIEFSLCISQLISCCEIDQIILHLSRSGTLKKLTLCIGSGDDHKLLPAFFNLQQLMVLNLQNCAFQPPVTFKGFSRLVSLSFNNISITEEVFIRFISNCPQLKDFTLIGDENHLLGCCNLEFVQLFECLPLVEHLCLSRYPIKCFATGVIPQKLPTLLVHLKYLHLTGLSFAREIDLRSVILLVTSSPNIETIILEMQHNPKEAMSQTAINLVDQQDYTYVVLDHLRVITITNFTNMKTGMDFVKLILAKSLMLKIVDIVIDKRVDINGEVKMLKELLQYPRASAKAEIRFERP